MIPGGGRWSVRLHQLVATQAALALALLGATRGGVIFGAASFAAAGFLTIIWVRVNDRPLLDRLRFDARRRSTRLDTPAAVLTLVAPHTLLTTADLAGEPAAVLVDDSGLTMLLELDEPSTALPPLRTLLPVPGEDQPPIRVQLVLTGVPAARDAGPAAGSYRSLSADRHDFLGQLTALLAIRLPRTEGWPEEELQRLLLSLGRRLIRRLRTHAVRPLDRDAAVRAITDLSHAEPPDQAYERWTALRLGRLHQATFHCRPESGVLPAHLITRLLHLPTAATTLALTAMLSGRPAESLLIRLATPDVTALDNAAGLLRRLLDPEHVALRRWDGAHLAGLSATLPLGTGPATGRPVAPGSAVPAVSAGLLLGRNRHGAPISITLFRPRPTRVLLVGSLACAQLLTFRALATGARVTVHSARAPGWRGFARGSGGVITLLPGDRAGVTDTGSPLRPVLTVLDCVSGALPIGRWHTTLEVRDHLTPTDLAGAADADLLVLQTLDPVEAELLGEALHLGDTAGHLTRMRPAMVALVGRSTVRWAVLAPTPIEKVLIGTVGRTPSNDKSLFD